MSALGPFIAPALEEWGQTLPADERWLVVILQRVMAAAAPALVPERQDFLHGEACKVESATQRVLQAIGRGLFQGAWALQLSG